MKRGKPFKKKILLGILIVARACGAFAVARRVTASDLRILCYHGASLYDEHRFRPSVFMRAETFARRVRFLARGGYPVLPLNEAHRRLKEGRLPKCATVITFDDGWYGTLALHHPILHEHGMPYTVYVSSYYVDKETQIFNVAVRYVVWRAGVTSLDLTVLGLDGQAQNAEDICRHVIRAGDALPTAADRQDLLRRLCDVVGVNWRDLEERRLIAFLNRREVAELAAAGVDVQLHTHRHRFPDDADVMRKEIEDNRRSLEGVVERPLVHFCYPSGVFHESSDAVLRDADVVTATTTRPGFNRQNAHDLHLTRFLDSDAITDIEFEAEMTGFFELIRRCGYRI